MISLKDRECDMIRWEEPILVPLAGVTKVRGLCDNGSGDSGDCGDGNVALGSKCRTGHGAIIECSQLGNSAGDCNVGNGTE